MSGTIEVFYVTALRKGMATDEAAIHAAAIAAATTGGTVAPYVVDSVRQDVAKFFTRADAEKHAAERLGSGWFSPLVELRTETLDEQHHAHGGKVGAPPPER